jgi:hypothetical protein
MSNTVSKVSWTAVAESMESRSTDDVRHQWNLKILPLFIPDQHVWTQQDDKNLLQYVVDLDLYGISSSCSLIQSSSSIRFADADIENKSADQCLQRWFVLVKSTSKGLGQRIEPSKVAEDIIEHMETKKENVAVPEKPKVNTSNITIDDSNKHIDIRRYYIEKYQNI